MDIIEHLQAVTLESFLANHPRTTETMRGLPIPPIGLGDPLLVIAAESEYNRNAFNYVCQVAGTIGENSTYPYAHLAASQVLAAASIEEGGMPNRGFLDPHASLRLWMVKVAEDWAGRRAVPPEFAVRAGRRMGEVYLWRGSDHRTVADRFAAMLGAHLASELLAAQQEFPMLVGLFQEKQPTLFERLRATVEPHFGFNGAAWIEGHPAVETKHAGFAARAGEAAAWGLAGVERDRFWESFYTGFGEFCENDQRYFIDLAAATGTLTAV